MKLAEVSRCRGLLGRLGLEPDRSRDLYDLFDLFDRDRDKYCRVERPVRIGCNVASLSPSMTIRLAANRKNTDKEISQTAAVPLVLIKIETSERGLNLKSKLRTVMQTEKRGILDAGRTMFVVFVQFNGSRHVTTRKSRAERRWLCKTFVCFSSIPSA